MSLIVGGNLTEVIEGKLDLVDHTAAADGLAVVAGQLRAHPAHFERVEHLSIQ